VSPIKENFASTHAGYRWVMLALVWLLYFVFGIFMRSISTLITPIIKDLNISNSQMGLILGSWPLIYIFVALIGGALIDRWGLRKCLFAGIIIIAISGAIRYFVHGFTTMFFAVALMGLGGPMISIGSPKTVALWFSGKERATAVGAYMTGPAIGGLLAYSLTNSVVMPLTGYSWRLTFVTYSVLALLIGLLWLFLSRDIKTANGPEKINFIKVFRSLATIRNAQLVMVLGFLSLCIGHGFNDWLPKMLENGGMTPANAGFAASIPVIIGLPITLFVPRLIPPQYRGRAITILSLVYILPLLLIPGGKNVPMYTGLVLLGAMTVTGAPLLMLILMDTPEIGSRFMGAAAGMFFCISPLGQFIGPWIMGSLTDLSGGFFSGSAVLAGLSLAMAIIAQFLKTKPAALPDAVVEAARKF